MIGDCVIENPDSRVPRDQKPADSGTKMSFAGHEDTSQAAKGRNKFIGISRDPAIEEEEHRISSEDTSAPSV